MATLNATVAHRTQLEPKIEYRMVKDPWGLSMVLNMDRRHLTGEQKKRVYVLVREQRGVQHQGGDRKSINPTFVGLISPTQADYASEMGVTLPIGGGHEQEA